jgi:hypothetical protein
MGGDTWDTRCLGVWFDKLPDDLFAQHLARDSVIAIYRTEDVTFRDTSWRCPSVDGHLNPGRHRSGADATVFADQVNDAPAAISLL